MATMFSFFVEPPRILWASGSAIVLGLIGIVASITGMADGYFDPVLGIPVAVALIALGATTLVFTDFGEVAWTDLPASRKRIVGVCVVIGVLTFIYVGLLLWISKIIYAVTRR